MCSVKKQIYIISKSGLVSVASLPALKLSLQGTERGLDPAGQWL